MAAEGANPQPEHPTPTIGRAEIALSDEAKFGLGALAVVLALVGLFVAARAMHGPWCHVGLGVFGVCVLAVLVPIRLSTGKTPEAPAEPRQREAAEDRSVSTPRTPEPRPELRPESREQEAVADRRG